MEKLDYSLIKKADRIVGELARIGNLVVSLQEENQRLKKLISEKEREIEQLLEERKQLRERIRKLVLKLKEFEELVTEGRFGR